MKSRSESRFRYGSTSGFTSTSSAAAMTSRSARRHTVRATCKRAAVSVPPGRMKLRSSGQLGVEAVAVRLERVDELLRDPQTIGDAPRDAEVGADVEELVLHPGEHRPEDLRQVAGERDADVELSSSTVPNEAMRQSSFETRDPSPRLVSPASPARV